jgi:hypothetical protein
VSLREAHSRHCLVTMARVFPGMAQHLAFTNLFYFIRSLNRMLNPMAFLNSLLNLIDREKHKAKDESKAQTSPELESKEIR